MSAVMMSMPEGVTELTEQAAQRAERLRAGHQRAEAALGRLRTRSESVQQSSRASLAQAMRAGLDSARVIDTVEAVRDFVLTRPHATIEVDDDE